MECKLTGPFDKNYMDINLNITRLECKLSINDRVIAIKEGIWISPDWNVNLNVVTVVLCLTTDLNITRLECKYFLLAFFLASDIGFEYHQIGM